MKRKQTRWKSKCIGSRVRIRKYRVIYEIYEKEKIVVFHDVDLRRRVY